MSISSYTTPAQLLLVSTAFYRFRNFGPFKVSLSADEAFSIGNNNISATVSVCDGTLKVMYIFIIIVLFVQIQTGSHILERFLTHNLGCTATLSYKFVALCAG